MQTETNSVTILSESDCWALLATTALGRLVTSVDGEPEIFPLNFAVQGQTVLFSTAQGTKLVSAAINSHVLFEADGHTATEGWSVIVKGIARALRTDAEITEAAGSGLRPWTTTPKDHWVRIRPIRVTGRRFDFSHAGNG
ncbi:pyridoxamine 5'-phosphate oxidase family protein [Mycobacterium sp. OTB74]|jgi:nitroimidazol reductase NimA-like FMN-containing flavoprotein (pyridoxamine 5'-phosphate oxidase superfamily)|uniref:pyridoxamine 5'-phosphate oxidase family protein n=1 Tax=Mycobacterium sp. OTB74 TaxID=1853452 RepID=UPI002473CB27|nr:pyridoxamine 5'-phosphate oxidase family protein [Mycobacterium sp. OTB74]MDH6246991.1 nitroimidazol reductase NimA-like FMN-containing flavoprotein (pyridoxamine 5'-phosphate oxidase superfamily) [Mycobacterium sp. OTB74]